MFPMTASETSTFDGECAKRILADHRYVIAFKQIKSSVPDDDWMIG
jgi:hypothetical protein